MRSRWAASGMRIATTQALARRLRFTSSGRSTSPIQVDRIDGEVC